MINIIGAKTAAILQTVLTCIIGGAGILLIIASVINGTVDNPVSYTHLDVYKRQDKVTAEMIPALCDYVIFSENGEKIGGDLSEQYLSLIHICFVLALSY